MITTRSLAQPSLARSIGQGVLAGGGFAIMLDLSRRGLANIDVGGALRV